MKIYLDDIRIPPDESWTWVKTPLVAITLLKEGMVKEISLDHDLGDDKEIGTGYDVLLWIEEKVFTENFKSPKIYIHTANVSARKKMELALKNIEQYILKNQLT